MSVSSDSDNPIKPAVLRPAELPAIDRGSGNKTILLVSGKIGSRQMLNGITSIAPGAAIALHMHNCEESVIVIEGRAVVEFEGVDHSLDTFDTTWVPANVPHRFKNPSSERPLRIFWSYASINATRTVIGTDEMASIAAEHQTPR
jgi:putative monooxygenase